MPWTSLFWTECPSVAGVRCVPQERHFKVPDRLSMAHRSEQLDWLLQMMRLFPAGTAMAFSSAIPLSWQESKLDALRFCLFPFQLPLQLQGWSKLCEAFPVLGCCSFRLEHHPRALLAIKADEMRGDTWVFDPNLLVPFHGWEKVYSIPIYQVLLDIPPRELINFRMTSALGVSTTFLVDFSKAPRKIMGI